MKSELIILFASDTIIFLFLYLIHKQQTQLKMTTEEAVTALTEATALVTKIGEETKGLQTKVSDLETALGATSELPQSVVDALTALKDQLGVVDNLVPDATV